MKLRLREIVRYRIQLFWIWILVLFMFVPCALSGQSKESPATGAATQETVNQAVIDEINAIRQQLGGGIGEQLKGLDFGKTLNAQLKNDFEQELNRLANQDSSLDSDSGSGSDTGPAHDSAQNQAISQAEKPDDSDARRPPPRSREVPFQRPLRRDRVPNEKTPQYSNDSPRVFAPNRPPGANSAPLQSGFLAFNAAIAQPAVSHARSLRLAARRLEEIAAELENTGLYEEADSVRQQARTFWLKARPLGD